MRHPETKNGALEKFLKYSHPQTQQLLSRKGPRYRAARLSQHYIGPKVTFCHLSNFFRKKSSGLSNHENFFLNDKNVTFGLMYC